MPPHPQIVFPWRVVVACGFQAKAMCWPNLVHVIPTQFPFLGRWERNNPSEEGFLGLRPVLRDGESVFPCSPAAPGTAPSDILADLGAPVDW